MRALKTLTFVSVLALSFPAYADTLTEALVKAYTTNPDLEAARATLRATDELAPQALSGYRPSVTASGSVARTNEDSNAGEDDYTSRAAALSLEQPIFRGGRTAAAVRQADSSIAAQRASLLNTEQTVMLRGVEGYLNVVRDTAVLELNKNNEEVLQRQLRATRDRFNVGEVTRTDVSQAEARLSAATSARIQADGNLTASRASYQRLFGEAPADLKKPEVAGLNMPKSLDEAIEEAKASNPNVLAASNSKEAAEASLDTVEGERLPVVSAEASLQRSYDAGSSATDRVDTATAGVSLNWPLYQAGSTSSRIREAKQQVARRASERDAAERGVIEATTQSWENWQTAKSSVESRRAQVKAARVALDGVQEEANVGSRTVLDTLDAEQELLDAQVGLVRAEHDEILAQYQVLAAVGRLTARELQLPVEYYDETAYSKRVRNQWIGSSTEQ